MIRFAFGAIVLLAGCSPAPPAADYKQAVELAPVKSETLEALNKAHDWQYDPGEALNASWNEGVKAILGKMSRPDAIGAIEAAGFECMYGEAHEEYPDPMAVCTRSFATRDCQMDWEISSTAEKAMVDEVDGSFKRDCVLNDRDWPDKVNSAIDEGLAPQTPPATPI